MTNATATSGVASYSRIALFLARNSADSLRAAANKRARELGDD